MGNNEAVRVAGLTVVRGGHSVLQGLNWSVPSGQIVGLLGPSGCGKTTLMRCLVGVQVVAGGAVTVLDLPAGSAALRRRVGYVTQTPSVYGDLTVTENLRYFATVVGIRHRELTAEVTRLLRLVDLESRAQARADQLSGGQRSRVSLAAALLGTALGLLVSAFARTEFQAAQFLPALVLPQFLLCGLLTPRNALPPVLHGVSDVLPLSYAVDAMRTLSSAADGTADVLHDVSIVLAFVAGAVVLGAATLRRRTG